jgi:hypothetical protein
VEAQLNGAFDFNATPLAPSGTRFIIHKKAAVRQTWAPHGIDGWYIGPAREHYCCYQVHCTCTGKECITETVEFFLFCTAMPKLSSADIATHAAKALTAPLLNPSLGADHWQQTNASNPSTCQNIQHHHHPGTAVTSQGETKHGYPTEGTTNTQPHP